ncbi:hypothetical protein GCM10017643_35150 [Ancylobacter dichloromethanicus]|uniref:Uncharacterized protein n=1 Tax=Ancylobacter dichloromethanicus TaxID=518825 RepID=A0A9W6JBT7_9HYPH|nr:hypothetical protein GCM10017643_35150 [Ancylobacter dichloromethanicus]
MKNGPVSINMLMTQLRAPMPISTLRQEAKAALTGDAGGLPLVAFMEVTLLGHHRGHRDRRHPL